MTISALGWVSFGTAEAEAVNALIGALADSEARDELGIGAIRDGFSDLLFPGTSTVQTRLRYFLMIPRIFLNLDLRVRDPQAALRQAEAALIERIRALPENADRAHRRGQSRESPQLISYEEPECRLTAKSGPELFSSFHSFHARIAPVAV